MDAPVTIRSGASPSGAELSPEAIQALPVLRVRWQLQFTKCSLRCPYCIAEWTKRPVNFKPDRFDQIIDRLLAQPYRLVIRLGVEGEIFLSPEIQEGVIRLSHHPKVEGVSFSTNMIASDEKVEAFLNKADCTKVGMGCTIHDTQLTDEQIEGFFRRIEMIQKRGVLVFVGYVAKPDRFEYMRKYKARLDALGVPFISNEYNGAIEHVPYPEAYTTQERAELPEFLFADHYYRMLVERDSPKGKPCLAGHRYIYLSGEGKVLRCGMERNLPWNLWQKLAWRINKDWPAKMQLRRIHNRSLGNILTDDLKLDEKPGRCPHTSCTCGNEAQAFYAVGKDYHRTRTLRVIYPKDRAAEYEARYPNMSPLPNDTGDVKASL
jgi:MoaA/NifB/PqqE/SkfB family radical SAM enzyme